MNYFGNIAKDTIFLRPFLLFSNLYSKVVLPEFPEDAYPDVPEMEPIKEKIKYFNHIWKQLEATINESFIPILNLEIADRTPEELLQKVVETMESKSCNRNIYCQNRYSYEKWP